MFDLVIEIFELIMNIPLLSEENIKDKANNINKKIGNLSDNQKQEICALVDSSLEYDYKEAMYVYSAMSHLGIENSVFTERMINILCDNEYDVLKSCMLEYCISCEHTDIPYEKKKKMHMINEKRIYKELSEYMEFIPIKERNKNRILILTEQIVSNRHMPTDIILKMYITLTKELGYEVVLVTCPSDLLLEEQEYYNGEVSLSSIDKDNDIMCVTYNDVSIPVFNVGMKNNNVHNYKILINMICQWKPYFIFAAGVFNPIAGMLKWCNTVVAYNFNTDFPLMSAQVILKKGYQNMKNADYIDKSTQVYKIIDRPLPVDIPGALGTKKEKSKKQFNIIIIGNRLNFEINKEMSVVIKRILDIDKSVVINLVGGYGYLEVFFEEKYRDRILIEDYCMELPERISKCELYLNPKRYGGGVSALIALKVGVPVVTLPDCDTAVNCGNEFVVNDFEEMIQVVKRYFYDDEFYDIQSSNAIRLFSKYDEYKLKDYMEEIISEIDKIMTENKEVCENDTI